MNGESSATEAGERPGLLRSLSWLEFAEGEIAGMIGALRPAMDGGRPTDEIVKAMTAIELLEGYLGGYRQSLGLADRLAARRVEEPEAADLGLRLLPPPLEKYSARELLNALAALDQHLAGAAPAPIEAAAEMDELESRSEALVDATAWELAELIAETGAPQPDDVATARPSREFDTASRGDLRALPRDVGHVIGAATARFNLDIEGLERMRHRFLAAFGDLAELQERASRAERQRDLVIKKLQRRALLEDERARLRATLDSEAPRFALDALTKNTTGALARMESYADPSVPLDPGRAKAWQHLLGVCSAWDEFKPGCPVGMPFVRELIERDATLLRSAVGNVEHLQLWEPRRVAPRRSA